MLKKLLIPMGLVSALGASTVMAVDLDGLTAATKLTSVIANDSLLTTNAQAGSGANLGKTYYRVTNSTNDATTVANHIATTGSIGVGLGIGEQVWIRYTLTGGAFDGVATLAMLSLNNGDNPDLISEGGAAGSSTVVYQYTVAGTVIDQAEDLIFTPVNVGWDGVSALGVSVSTYERLSDATNSTNALTTKSGTILVGATGVRVLNNPASVTAEVASLFTAFNAAGTVVAADLGSISIDSSTVAAAAPVTAGTFAVDSLTGDVFAVDDAVTIAGATSLTTITGDFSFGTFTTSVNACVAATGAISVAAGTLNAAKTTATVPSSLFSAIGAVGNHGSLCMTADGTETIPVAAAYTASIALAPVAARAQAQAVRTATFGAIKHNGTTVQLPYLTTFEGYNQRLVIVNRGTTDATYSVTFTPETGSTATAGTAATGTVAAGSTSSIKVTDIVTMTGKTRTAGAIVIVAPTTSLSVATNQVTLADGSTDTVVLL